MNTVELLKAARASIADPANWTKNAFALYADGSPASTSDKNACTFCAIGAVWHVAEMHTENGTLPCEEEVNRLLNQVARRRGEISVVQYNDSPHTTHEDILSLYDEAIAEASAE